ncbi:hypothetical protein RFI_29982, partial [Reticulomyxa filosa]
MLINDIKSHLDPSRNLFKWDLFFLTPCLNYLSLSSTNNTSGVNLSQRFQKNDYLEWKDNDLDKKVISVLQTDLRIRKLNVIAPKYSEEYVLDLLIIQKDKKLSQSILEFLFSQDNEIWDHVCSNSAEKCWEVMLMVFQADFEQWSRYFEQLNTLGIFEGGGLGSSFLSKFQIDTEFIKLVESPKNFLAFLAFIQQQKMIWKYDYQLLTTIENCYKQVDYCESVVFRLIDILWNKLNLESQPLSDKVNEITTNLLKKGTITFKNLEVWIQLFSHNVKKNEDKWEDLLTESLKNWWLPENFGEKFTGTCYHRKVIWFFHPSRYNKIEKNFRKVFKEQMELKVNHFYFDNKCWDEDSRNELKNYAVESLSKQDGSTNEWLWLLSFIIKIPTREYYQNNNYEFFVYLVDENIVSKADERKSSQNEANEHDTELFKGELEYCAACFGWKEVLTDHKEIEILRELWTFIKETLDTLDCAIKTNKLTFSLCDFLKKDENEARIRKLGEDIIDLSKLDIEMEKFVKYKKLADNFMIVLQRYLSTIPAKLNAFYEFCRNLDHHYLSDMEIKFEEEQKLLSDFSKEFQLMVSRADGKLFHKMWTIRQGEYAISPISTIKDIVGVFKQADLDWNSLVSKIKEKTLQYADLEPYKNITWESETNIFFSNPELQEKKTTLQNIEYAFCFLQTEEHWRLLKRAITIIQNTPKHKMITKDKIWLDFVKIIEQSEKDEKETLITEASKWYLECQSCFGDISDKKDVLESICNNEKKIQDLATNEIFINQTQFEFAMQRMDDSQNQKFRHLAATLRDINQKMKDNIWNKQFSSSYELAICVLALLKQSNNDFGKRLKNCLEMDFEELFRLVKEGDQLSVVKGFEQFERAGQTGRWVLDDYETMFGLHQLNPKMNKYEGLTLQFGKNPLNCNLIEHTLDRLKLGLTSEGKKKIEAIILQYEICKDIYAIRIDYWERGGRDKKEKLIVRAIDPIETFEKEKKGWIDRLDKWKKECLSLRNNYPGLTYFTMNEAQHLI